MITCKQPPCLSETGRRMSSKMAPITFQKNPFRKSGTSDPAPSPVVPLFPQPPDMRGHNSEKRGIRAEQRAILRREWMRSYLAMLQRPKTGWDVVWDVGELEGILNRHRKSSDC